MRIEEGRRDWDEVDGRLEEGIEEREQRIEEIRTEEHK